MRNHQSTFYGPETPAEKAQFKAYQRLGLKWPPRSPSRSPPSPKGDD
jgi:hypothetical protein